MERQNLSHQHRPTCTSIETMMADKPKVDWSCHPDARTPSSPPSLARSSTCGATQPCMTPQNVQRRHHNNVIEMQHQTRGPGNRCTRVKRPTYLTLSLQGRHCTPGGHHKPGSDRRHATATHPSHSKQRCTSMSLMRESLHTKKWIAKSCSLA